MAKYYRLKNRYYLRGWEKLPSVIVEAQKGSIIFILIASCRLFIGVLQGSAIIAEEISRLGIQIRQLYTNGLLLNREILDGLKSIGQ